MLSPVECCTALPVIRFLSTKRALLKEIADLPFKDFEFHGYTGKRRVVSCGWRYDFSERRLTPPVDSLRYSVTFRNLRETSDRA